LTCPVCEEAHEYGYTRDSDGVKVRAVCHICCNCDIYDYLDGQLGRDGIRDIELL